MVDQEHITALEARLAALEARLAAIEGVTFKRSRAREELRKVLAGLDEPFSGRQVQDALVKAHPELEGCSYDNVRLALKAMAKAGEIIIMEKGTGPLPDLFISGRVVSNDQYGRHWKNGIGATAIIRKALDDNEGEITIEEVRKWAEEHVSKTRLMRISPGTWLPTFNRMVKQGELVKSGLRKRPPQRTVLGHIVGQPRPVVIYRRAKTVTSAGRMLTPTE